MDDGYGRIGDGRVDRGAGFFDSRRLRRFRGGIIAYASDLKSTLLGVAASVVDAGVVSEQTALSMAEGAVEALGVDVAVSLTGSAGPESQEQPVGTIIVGVVTPRGRGVRTFFMPGDRERVRTFATTAALQVLRLGLLGKLGELGE